MVLTYSISDVNSQDFYGILFLELKKSGYFFKSYTPDQLLGFRKNNQGLTALQLYFGLGLTLSAQLRLQILSEGLSEKTVAELPMEFPYSISSDLSGQFLIHDHWPPKKGFEENYIHLGPESFYLIEKLKKILPLSRVKNSVAVDLGCSSGVLSFFLTDYFKNVCGIDSSKISIHAACLIKSLREVEEWLHFETHTIDTNLNLPKVLLESSVDLTVFNPPLAIPLEGRPQAHRDGGKLGVEVPYLFLDFTYKLLKPGGRTCFIAGDPKISGKFQFENSIKNSKKWEIIDTSILEPYFNQAVYKEHGYANLGIEQIDLKYFELVKI